MREGGRTLLAVLAGACAALQPWAAYAAAPAPARAPVRQALPPAATATVDHPAVDRITSFDNGPREHNLVALTFDADMSVGMLQQLRSGAVASWYNQEVHDILEQEQVPATIFFTGLWAATYPGPAREIAHDPLFEIGNHSYDHAAFRTPCYGLAAARDRAAEISGGQAEIVAATGVAPTLIRFPGDCYDRSDVELARSMNLSVISGDVRSGDAFNRSAASVASNVMRGLQPGSIVIMHLQGGPNAPMTAPALRTIIQSARERGFGFTTVSGLLELHSRARPATAQEILAPLRIRPMTGPWRADFLARFRNAVLSRARADRQLWEELLA